MDFMINENHPLHLSRLFSEKSFRSDHDRIITRRTRTCLLWSQSVRLKLIHKAGRHLLWKVESSPVAEEHISEVEISGPAPNKEKQVVVVFSTKSSPSLKIHPLLCLFSPKIKHNTTFIHFHFPKLSLTPLLIVVRLQSTLNPFSNRKHAHGLG